MRFDKTAFRTNYGRSARAGFRNSVPFQFPGQFSTVDWSVADAGIGGTLTVTINALPPNGGATISDIEYQVNGGGWVSSGLAAIGTFNITGLVDTTKYFVTLRAINDAGTVKADYAFPSLTLFPTAVDQFYYDTTLDSDGGVWRTGAKALASSWYSETLNTATRGATAAFPAQVMIVAEAAKVTIYDATDPGLPMWMVFNAHWKNAIYGNTLYPLTSVNMLNGILLTGASNGTAQGSISFVQFLSDSAVTTRGGFGNFLSDIAGRNSLVGHDGTNPYALVSPYSNDVAMTVLSGAPIDPATGIATPTIAVATDGGVSVINNDGTVTDSADVLGFANVAFAENGDLYANRNVFGGILIYSTVADYEASDGWGDRIGSTTFGSLQIDLLAYPQFTPQFAIGSGTLFSGESSGSPVQGLFLHAPDTSDFTKGMSALITSTYNTGWMAGDIKGAWLSDTGTTTVSGVELVTNGGFATDTDWSKEPGWTIAAGVANYDGSAPTLYNKVRQTAIPTTIGSTFLASMYISTIAGGSANLWLQNNGVTYGASATAPGALQRYFTSAAATTDIAAQENQNANALSVDNISMVKVEADRSVNGNHLTVNGTLTKTPVAAGAELVAYSGFSAVNYLSEAYNADYDFGIGDFCVMGWIKGTSTYDTLIHRAISSGGLFIRTGNAGKIEVFMDAGTTFSLKLTSVSVVNDGAWHLVVVRRLTGILSIHIDGVFDRSVGTITDITYASATLRIGNRIDAGDEAENLALVRISATAPTAAQILKMYNDELPLFQPNAAATLYGTSDAVTNITYNAPTDHLGVDTSFGRTVFSGLEALYLTSDLASPWPSFNEKSATPTAPAGPTLGASTFITASNTNSITIANPANAAGDVIYYFVCENAANSLNLGALPAGITAVATLTSADRVTQVLKRTSNGAEAPSETFNGGYIDRVAFAAVVSGATSEVVPVSASGYGTTLTAPSLTALANSLVFEIFYARSALITRAGSILSKRSGTTGLALSVSAGVAAGATAAQTATIGAGNQWGAAQFEIR